MNYPYDIISLDYSGGLFYKDRSGKAIRLQAVDALFSAQEKHQIDFILFISCNLHAIDRAEVKDALTNIQTELTRYGQQAEDVISAYLSHSQDQARLKLYVPYMVNQYAAKHHYNCETELVIFYTGNVDTQMMAFRFLLSFDSRTISLRPPRERLNQIVNSPFIEIKNGLQKRTLLGLPKLSSA